MAEEAVQVRVRRALDVKVAPANVVEPGAVSGQALVSRRSPVQSTKDRNTVINPTRWGLAEICSMFVTQRPLQSPIQNLKSIGNEMVNSTRFLAPPESHSRFSAVGRGDWPIRLVVHLESLFLRTIFRNFHGHSTKSVRATQRRTILNIEKQFNHPLKILTESIWQRFRVERAIPYMVYARTNFELSIHLHHKSLQYDDNIYVPVQSSFGRFRNFPSDCSTWFVTSVCLPPARKS